MNRAGILISVAAGAVASLSIPLPTGAALGNTNQACERHYGQTQSYTVPSFQANIDAQATVQCPVTSAPGPLVDGRPRQGTRTGYTPPQGSLPPDQEQPCGTLYARQPAVISWGAHGAEVDWLWPDGRADSHVNGDLPTAPSPADGLVPIDLAESVAGENHLFLWFKNDSATYGGAHGWQCQGGQWTFRDSCTYKGATFVSCVQVRVTGPLQSVSGRPPDPSPVIARRLAEMQKDVVGGSIGTSPSDPAHQFTVLPTCWWLNGVQRDQAFEIRIQDPTTDPSTGAPDGRAITYVYRVSVGLKDVHWDYGDGSSFDGDAGHPWTADTPDSCSNPHSYERTSVTGHRGAVACPAGYPHPSADDACYAVTAVETYAVSVAAYWFDGSQTHGPVDMGAMSPLTLRPNPPATFVRIQQIEGVPITR
jgi:hypothetical protein